MSKSITYQIVSQDPNNYNTVSFNPTIPWNTHKVQYKITNINTFSNFLITTNDDYIECDTNSGDPKKFTCFWDKTNWELEEIVKLLNETLPITVAITDSGVLSFEYTRPFTITNASHRVKLILGLYHTKFPIESNSNNTIIANSTPMLNYGNILYLKSLQGNSVGMIHDSMNVHAPCIYRINTFLKAGLPLLSDKKGDKIIVNAEAAKTITMQLVDFMYEPVILKSPMFITIKIKMHELQQSYAR